MSSLSYAPPSTSSSTSAQATADVAGTELAEPVASNSDQLAAAGLLSPITDWISDVWGWLWGGDETTEKAPEKQPETPVNEDPTCQTADGITPPDLTTAEGVNAADVRTSYANNPRAQAALDALTADPNFAGLSAEQQGGLIQRFQEAPNAATTEYLKGLAAYHRSDDPCGAGLAAYEDALKADGGTFTANGTTYTIQNGQLMDADGNVAGDIRTDGTYKLSGDEERRSYYDDIHTRVQMTEGEGKDKKTLLDLHDADPNSELTKDGVNDTFAGMATSTLQDVRREGMDMRIDNAYRSIADQDALYAKGRTAPGNKVTNAKGGQSWHNYGVAADIVFCDSKGNKSWPETGDYAKLWSRYGELAEANGLEWGGSWTSFKDRPHIEYHPGLTASDASTLKDEATGPGGLEAAWDAMGIGEQEDTPAQNQ